MFLNQGLGYEPKVASNKFICTIYNGIPTSPWQKRSYAEQILIFFENTTVVFADLSVRYSEDH